MTATRRKTSLSIRGVSKSFSGVEVLHGVDLDLCLRSVHAIVGENGAGKSTLIKILSGVHRRDAGEIAVDGKPVDVLSPRLAQGTRDRHDLPGAEPRPVPERGGEHPAGRRARPASSPWSSGSGFSSGPPRSWGTSTCDLDPRALVGSLGAGEQQAVEIAKALYKKARIVIMDEPTASLSGAEIDNLFRLIRALKQSRRVRHLHLPPAGRGLPDRGPGHRAAGRAGGAHPRDRGAHQGPAREGDGGGRDGHDPPRAGAHGEDCSWKSGD